MKLVLLPVKHKKQTGDQETFRDRRGQRDGMLLSGAP